MTTTTIKLSEQAIKRCLTNIEITQIKAQGEPFLMRPHKCRTRGSWYLVTHKGGTKRHKIANYPDLSVKGLNSVKAYLIEKHIKEESVYQDEFLSVGSLLNWYRDRALSDRNLSKNRKRGIKTVIDKHLIPSLDNINIQRLSKSNIDKFIWVKQSTLSIGYVRLCFMLLKKAFKQAHALSKISKNPMSSWNFTEFSQVKIKAKGSKLKESNIPSLINQIKLSSSTPFNRMLVLFMLAHGTRIGETRQMKWTDIDLDNRRITIPAQITKTKTELNLPITDWFYDWLLDHAATQRGYQGDYLFNSGTSCISEKTANEMVKSVSQGQWTAHDLRKLMRSMLADLGVDYMTSEQILNHAMSSLDKAYIHTHVEAQKAKALNIWHSYLSNAWRHNNDIG